MSSSTDDAKSDILSQDLLLYITHLEKAFNEIEESEEKTIIQEWLMMILERPRGTIAESRIRNMVLSQMLMDIESNKLRSPFNERPSKRAYNELVDWLTSVLNQNSSMEESNDVENEEQPVNIELNFDFHDHVKSIDNRTYIAVRTLPNNGGIFGYIAVSLGEGNDTQWLNSSGKPITTPVPSNLPVVQAKGDFQLSMPKSCDVKRVWYVLKNRQPSSLRNNSYEFYKMLHETVVNEMLSEANKKSCTNPFINKLLAFLEADLKAIGIQDQKIFCRIKLLSILKKQITTVLTDIEEREETFGKAMQLSKISTIITLPPKCCYNFVSSALWNEISYQRPGIKHMDILSRQYPQCMFPKYFMALAREKRNILTNVFGKYCKILNEMFGDLGNAIIEYMKRYNSAKWEWHLVYEIIDAYNRERAFKDSLCMTETTSDETADSFLAVILSEMEMAQTKLNSIVVKNDQLAEQVPLLRNEIGDRERGYKSMTGEYECKMDKMKREINSEKSDMAKREATIADLQRKLSELEK